MEEQYQYTKTKEIFSKEKDLPKLPGVYKFYDEKNKILKVGLLAPLSGPYNEIGNSLLLSLKLSNLSGSIKVPRLSFINKIKV